jgi:hypothetical protein
VMPEDMYSGRKKCRRDHLPFISGHLFAVPGEGHFFFLRNIKYRVFGNSMFHAASLGLLPVVSCELFVGCCRAFGRRPMEDRRPLRYVPCTFFEPSAFSLELLIFPPSQLPIFPTSIFKSSHLLIFYYSSIPSSIFRRPSSATLTLSRPHNFPPSIFSHLHGVDLVYSSPRSGPTLFRLCVSV